MEDKSWFIKEAEEIINFQVRAWITIPIDVEVYRENYIHYNWRHQNGFNFVNLEYLVWREVTCDSNLPAISEKVVPPGGGGKKKNNSNKKPN